MVMGTEEPFFAPGPVELDIRFEGPERQSRGTVAFRLLLALPQLIVLSLLGIVATVLAIIGWFAALILGRLPRWIATFELNVIAYSVRVNAYVLLLVDHYPPFTFEVGDYEVAVEMRASRLSRVKVFFRWLLVIPAVIVTSVASTGLRLFSVIIWLVTLIRGQTPQSMYSVAAAVIRYEARYYAYVGLVTDKYPRGLFGDGDSASTPEWVPDSERRGEMSVTLSKGARRLMVLIIVLGIAGSIGEAFLQARLRSESDPALAAEQRLEIASQTYLSSVNSCGTGAAGLPCLKTADRAWGEAFDRFASSLSHVRFSGFKQAEVSALARDARDIGQGLLAASHAKTPAEHNTAFRKVQEMLTPFEADATSLLGHGL